MDASNKPERWRQRRKGAQGITGTPRIAGRGKGDKREPTSVMKKGHEQGQDRQLVSRNEDHDVVIPP